MNVLIFGATGMVGRGALREALLDPGVERVVTVGRRATGQQDPKLKELVVPEVADLSSIEGELTGLDACLFCLGVSSVGMNEEKYTRLTYDLTLAAANTLARLNPGMTFAYVSGAGTDSTEQGRTMWARVKGRTENALLKLSFKAAYMFRPGMIVPLHDITPAAPWVRRTYFVLKPVLSLFRRLFPNQVTTTELLGRAMLNVARDGYPKPVLETEDIEKAAHSGGDDGR